MCAGPDDEVALDGLQDLLLEQHVLLLSLGNNVLLADALHGVIGPVIHRGHLGREEDGEEKIKKKNLQVEVTAVQNLCLVESRIVPDIRRCFLH